MASKVADSLQKVTTSMPEPIVRFMEQTKGKGGSINVGEGERWASLLGGGLLSIYGLTRFNLGGLLLTALGADLIYRGATGQCVVYQQLGVNTAKGDGKIGIEKSITIDKPLDEIYRYWRNFENLSRFMKHLETVTIIDSKKSHWVASAPFGAKVEWDAEITNERENELITWRSLPGSQIENIGAVRFMKAPDGRGTVVTVNLQYVPPAGPIGVAFARIFAEEPALQIQDDLRHLKQMLEAGEIPTISGQPNGKRIPA